VKLFGKIRDGIHWLISAEWYDGSILGGNILMSLFIGTLLMGIGVAGVIYLITILIKYL